MLEPGPLQIRWEIHRRDTVRSTMEEIDALAAAGAPEGTVVAARTQTDGRGRAGRSWVAPPGGGLLCSLLLRPTLAPHEISAWPLLLGLATAEACEEIGGTPCQIKWPNDVMAGGRKLAGVLVTTRSLGGRISHVTCGVGINLTGSPADLAAGATSVSALSSRLVSSDEALPLLLARVAIRYAGFLRDGGRPSLDEWVGRAAWIGDVVEIDDGAERRRGTYRGVDADGALLLETADGTTSRVVAGDLTRGPRPV
ncbi:MAG: biotin--[acetyl-CoA-carboxylase] ligase [Thermomicrobiales bacterium]